jgi:uncharacterized protein
MNAALDNYRKFVTQVDALCNGIKGALHEHILCAEGCSACCASITIFPVEAAALNAALELLSTEEADAIRRHVKEFADGERCPLLLRHRCLLYAARPIICRTHGFPILYTENDKRRMDCCPLNLERCESLPGSAVIELDRLNTILVAINSLFISQAGQTSDLPERLSIAEAILGLPNS